jgi:hypothetical protein
MKTALMLVAAALAGFVGGISSRLFIPERAPATSLPDQSPFKTTRVEVFADADHHCTLTGRGLECVGTNGSFVRLSTAPVEVEVSSDRELTHTARISASNDTIKAAYLTLDGRLWYAPGKLDRARLTALLAMTGQIDLDRVE